MPKNLERFQGWLAFITAAALLGLLAIGVVIAVVRLIQIAWNYLG